MRNRPGQISLAVAVLAGLAFAAPAAAKYDPVGSGTTKLTFDKTFLAAMKRAGVRIVATSPARLQGGSISFPAVGGRLDPTSGRGAVEHEGAVVFAAGSRRIPITDLQLKTSQRGSPLSAKVGGSQLKLGTVRKVTVRRSGFGAKASVAGLALGAKLATRLGKKLHLKGSFRQGRLLGSSMTRVQPETVTVLGRGKAAMTLDAGFEAKLQSLFVAVNPIFPAERSGSAFTLPISGGTISPDGRLGTLESSGALEFIQLGGGQVFWQDIWLELGAGDALADLNVQPSPPYAGKAERSPFARLTLSSAASANPGARTVTVAGATLALDASTAATFNEVFAKPQGKDGLFAAGEVLGSVSFTAQGQ